MKSNFRINYMYGESIRSNEISTVLDSYYDLAIYNASWDKRCLVLTSEKKIKAKYGIVILFKKKDPIGFRKHHDKQLIKHAAKSCKKLIFIREESTNIESLGKIIQDAIISISKREKKPLNILVDISSLPRFYVGFIMGFAFKNDLVKSITNFYAEGNYITNLKDENFKFTSGKWSPVKIPTLEGKNDPYKRKFALISVGFEGIKTLQMVDGVDPDRVAILMPIPGYTKDYTQKTKEENKSLLPVLYEAQVAKYSEIGSISHTISE